MLLLIATVVIVLMRLPIQVVPLWVVEDVSVGLDEVLLLFEIDLQDTLDDHKGDTSLKGWTDGQLHSRLPLSFHINCLLSSYHSLFKMAFLNPLLGREQKRGASKAPRMPDWESLICTTAFVVSI